MKPYERKCSNWLQSFLDWTVPRSMAPESVLTLCALFTLSSALRRHVKVGRKYLGTWDCYPNLYVIFVADAGIITKSTSIGLAEELLDELQHITRSPSSITSATLVEKLSSSPDGSLCCIISEFGLMMEKAGITLYTNFTDLFDARKFYTESTMVRGDKAIGNPCINLLGATTPDWISDNMPATVLNGGFGSRTIFLKELAPRNPKFFQKPLVDAGHFEKIKADLVADLNHISEFVEGEFEYTPEAEEWFEKWYQESLLDKGDLAIRLKGYKSRRPAYVTKLAMLMTIAVTDELVIHLPVIQEAVKLMKFFESKMTTVFKSIGKNLYTADILGMKKYIEENKKVPRDRLLEEFLSSGEPEKIQSWIEMLIQMNKIKPKMDEGVMYYYYVGE